MTNEEKILKILKDNNGIVTTKEVEENNIDKIYLTRLVKKGIIDKIKSNADEAEQIANRISIRNMISALNEREKQIILLRYYKNNTQSQVAKILGISQVQVSRIEKKILERMKLKMVNL